MAQSKNFYPKNSPLPALPVTSFGEQYKRQRISDDWEPNGFERYAYQKALKDSMPVIGGPDDQFMGNPDRYEPVSEQMEVEFPIGGGKKKKK